MGSCLPEINRNKIDAKENVVGLLISYFHNITFRLVILSVYCSFRLMDFPGIFNFNFPVLLVTD